MVCSFLRREIKILIYFMIGGHKKWRSPSFFFFFFFLEKYIFDNKHVRRGVTRRRGKEGQAYIILAEGKG